MPIEIKIEDGMYVAYYYEKEITRAKTLTKVTATLAKYCRGQNL